MAIDKCSDTDVSRWVYKSIEGVPVGACIVSTESKDMSLLNEPKKGGLGQDIGQQDRNVSVSFTVKKTDIPFF